MKNMKWREGKTQDDHQAGAPAPEGFQGIEKGQCQPIAEQEVKYGYGREERPGARCSSKKTRQDGAPTPPTQAYSSRSTDSLPRSWRRTTAPRRTTNTNIQ